MTDDVMDLLHLLHSMSDAVLLPWARSLTTVRNPEGHLQPPVVVLLHQVVVEEQGRILLALVRYRLLAGQHDPKHRHDVVQLVVVQHRAVDGQPVGNELRLATVALGDLGMGPHDQLRFHAGPHDVLTEHVHHLAQRGLAQPRVDVDLHQHKPAHFPAETLASIRRHVSGALQIFEQHHTVLVHLFHGRVERDAGVVAPAEHVDQLALAVEALLALQRQQRRHDLQIDGRLLHEGGVDLEDFKELLAARPHLRHQMEQTVVVFSAIVAVFREIRYKLPGIEPADFW
uniref:Uncharacterized protein n=1 Tax=Anopheles atroparvus TaxID=41427 RepID=A0A182JFQ6_ANOAO